MYSVPDLQTFVAVARRGGITSGAASVGISAATTSHRIAKLESRLGIKLFHRDNRHFTLSDEGQIFLERVEPLLIELQLAEIEAGGGRSALRGHLRATMSPWILSRFILPNLADFRQKHPDLTIEFLTVDRFVPLVEEGQDCAIRVGNLADSSLIAKKLSNNDRIICASPDFIERYGTPVSIDELQQALWVCLPWQMQINVRAKSGSPKRLNLTRNVTVSNSDMLTEGAIQGLGMAVKSRLAVADEMSDGRLMEIMPGTLTPAEAPIWFLSPPNARNSRKTMEFQKLVTQAFRSGSA